MSEVTVTITPEALGCFVALGGVAFTFLRTAGAPAGPNPALAWNPADRPLIRALLFAAICQLDDADKAQEAKP